MLAWGRPMSEPVRTLAVARLLEEMPIGVVVIDAHGRVVLYNAYEEKLARRRRETVLGRSFFEEIAPCLNARSMRERVLAGIAGGALDLDEELSFDFRFFEAPRDVHLRGRTFVDGGEPFGILLLEDIGERRALERLRASLGTLLVRDMKSPLRAALAQLTLVERELRDPPELALTVHETRRSLARIEAMVSGLLEVARLETGTLPVTRVPVDPAQVLGDVAHDLSVAAKERGVALVNESESDELEEVAMDATLVRRALGHLGENALRHARSRVRLRVRTDGARAIFEVEDDGPGVPEEARAALFEGAPTGEEVRLAAPDVGLGVGLPFARLVAREHGGELLVRSAPGGGAVFALSVVRGAGVPR